MQTSGSSPLGSVAAVAIDCISVALDHDLGAREGVCGDLLADAQTHPWPQIVSCCCSQCSAATAAIDAIALPHHVAHFDAFAARVLREGVQERVHCRVSPSWTTRDLINY